MVTSLISSYHCDRGGHFPLAHAQTACRAPSLSTITLAAPDQPRDIITCLACLSLLATNDNISNFGSQPQRRQRTHCRTSVKTLPGPPACPVRHSCSPPPTRPRPRPQVATSRYQVDRCITNQDPQPRTPPTHASAASSSCYQLSRSINAIDPQ
jgi:hypothetical protein